MGIFYEIGKAFNELTGVTAQNEHQESLANSAHQREVADLKAAGLNPVLSAGGDGAPMPQTGTPAGNPFDVIMNAINTAKTAEKTDADIKNETSQTLSNINKNNAEILKIAKENGYTDEKIQNAIKERDLIIETAKKAKSEKELIDAQAKMKKWESEHPFLVNLWAPMATAVAGGLAGGISGGLIGGLMGGINSAKQHQYKMTEKGLQMNSGGIDPRSLGIGI